jgi:hypothetical protein
MMGEGGAAVNEDKDLVCEWQYIEVKRAPDTIKGRKGTGAE